MDNTLVKHNFYTLHYKANETAMTPDLFKVD